MRRIHLADLLNLEKLQVANNNKIFITPYAKKLALKNGIKNR